MSKNYHCCATCQHFRVIRGSTGHTLMCSRLGYTTKSNYKFTCWVPRPDIAAKIEEMRRTRE